MEKIIGLVGKVEEINSIVKAVPSDDLNLMEVKIEQVKTHVHGHIYFVSHPYIDELSDSVFAMSKDGSLHCEHRKNVFSQTHS